MGISIAIFILIIAIIFVSYQAFIFYRSEKAKRIDTEREKKETHLTDTSFNEHETLPNEGKDLINFLKMNSPSNEINNETFRVQNLLNEVHGLIETSLQKNNIEFIYDIDSSVPIELVGDSLHIEQTLHILLSQIIPLSQNETITVKFKKDSKTDAIMIDIHNSKHIDLGETTAIETAQTLLQQLNASLSIKDNIYSIHLPFLRNNLYNEVYFSLPKTVIGQKVLLIEDNTLTAQTISKTFQHFGLEVTIELTSKLSQIQKMNLYDIMVIDTKLLTPIIMRHIEEIKTHKPLYIISLETLYGQRDRRFKPNPLVSKYLYKPLSTNMIFGFLYEIYVMHKHENIESVQKKEEKNTEVFFIEETENITRESFQDFNHIHILIVEDNKINQKIIESILAKSDIQITIANNGQEALDCLDDGHNIDIVLMDINMPIMDGYQATKKIRENPAFSSLFIVIISTLGFRNEIDQMYLAGANAHLTKPFQVGQLYNALHIFSNTQETHSTQRLTSTYVEDTSILDIQKGSATVKNILAYRDILRETLVTLKHSDEKIKKYIIKKDFIALKAYCARILVESEYIGATSLTQVINEMRILLNNHEEEFLQKYILLYRDEWIKTKRNIELYLKSVNT